jgi:hypothetical protein
MFLFGAGILWSINSNANSTPYRVAQLQDTSFNFDFTLKELRGQSQFPVDLRRGSAKMSGKAKFALLNSSAVNDLFFGNTKTAGLLLSALAEAGTIPSSTPWTVTVANAANFDTDLGVQYAAGGYLTKVASSPATGQYSVAAGVYTFASGDAGKGVLIDYLYTATTGGNRIALTNNLMGNTPTFMGVWTAQIGGKTCTLKLNQVASSKFDLALKQEDYGLPDFDINAMDNGTGSLGTFSIAD